MKFLAHYRRGELCTLDVILEEGDEERMVETDALVQQGVPKIGAHEGLQGAREVTVQVYVADPVLVARQLDEATLIDVPMLSPVTLQPLDEEDDRWSK